VQRQPTALGKEGRCCCVTESEGRIVNIQGTHLGFTRGVGKRHQGCRRPSDSVFEIFTQDGQVGETTGDTCEHGHARVRTTYHLEDEVRLVLPRFQL
jgi:hypothetical protein